MAKKQGKREKKRAKKAIRAAAIKKEECEDGRVKEDDGEVGARKWWTWGRAPLPGCIRSLGGRGFVGKAVPLLWAPCALEVAHPGLEVPTPLPRQRAADTALLAPVHTSRGGEHHQAGSAMGWHVGNQPAQQSLRLGGVGRR